MTELSWRQGAVDIVNLALAVLLGLSPWAIGFAEDPLAAPNAWVSGVAIGVLALAALMKFAEWEEWINFALGLWVVASPWVLGFAMHEAATWTHVILGLMVAALAAVMVWLTHQPPPHATAGH